MSLEQLSQLPPTVIAALLTSVTEGTLVTDGEQNCLYTNAAFTRITGYSEAEALGKNPRFLQGHETDPGVVSSIRKALANGDPFRGDVLNYRKNGEPFWNSMTIVPVRGASHDIDYFVSVQHELTEKLAAERRVDALLAETQLQRETSDLLLNVARSLSMRSRVREVAQAVSDAVPTVCGSDRSSVLLLGDDSESFHIVASSGWEGPLADRVRVFERTLEARPEVAHILSAGVPALLGRHGPAWVQTLLDEYAVEAIAGVPIAAGGELRGVLLAQWVSDPPAHLTGVLQSRMSGLAGLAAVALDNTRLLEELRWNALHDPLTGLPNRALLEQRLKMALSDTSESGKFVAVIFGDIDRFKRINDSLGHTAGDSVLWLVASRLEAIVRNGDIVSRPSGDEFVVVLQEVDGIEAAYFLANRIEKAFEEPFAIDGSEVYVSMSLGVAISNYSPEVGASLESVASKLLNYADDGMYRVKARKRGLFAPSRSAGDFRLDADLRSAAQRDEFIAHFQPQIDARTGRIVAVEALVRWLHPELGQIPPRVFVPIAEENGVILEVGEFMLRRACALAASWSRRGVPLEVSVNVSPVQLARDNYFERVRRALEEYALAPHLLTVEVTESAVITDVQSVGKHLRKLRSLGLGVAVDDFGTGYSSLSQLGNLPVTELKIDQSFVQGKGPTGEALITAVVVMSSELGLRVVAEGVETETHLQMVRKLGCDRAQGHFIGKPMAAADLEAMIVADQSGAIE